MAVHTISLTGAVLILLVAIVLLFILGPLALVLLIVVAILIWYAIGPGSRSSLAVR
jgi:hypothetical protein